MKFTRSAQVGVQDYIDEETDRRRTIIAGEGQWGLPSLQPYLEDVRDLRPLSGVESELFNKTLQLVKVQDQQDREDIDRMIQAEQDRMCIIRGENPLDDYSRFDSETDYIMAVRSLGDLSSEEHSAYMGWQTVILDTFADYREAQEDAAYGADDEYFYPSYPHHV